MEQRTTFTAKEASALAHEILHTVQSVVVGKDMIILKVLLAMLAKGHVLLEDMPGVGKTTLALAFAKTLDLDYHRIQFTPDVLPSDVTGFCGAAALSAPPKGIPRPRTEISYAP